MALLHTRDWLEKATEEKGEKLAYSYNNDRGRLTLVLTSKIAPRMPTGEREREREKEKKKEKSGDAEAQKKRMEKSPNRHSLFPLPFLPFLFLFARSIMTMIIKYALGLLDPAVSLSGSDGTDVIEMKSTGTNLTRLLV